MSSPSLRPSGKVSVLVTAFKEEHHANFLSSSGHPSHVEAAEAAYRKRRTIEGNCTSNEIRTAYALAERRGYLH